MGQVKKKLFFLELVHIERDQAARCVFSRGDDIIVILDTYLIDAETSRVDGHKVVIMGQNICCPCAFDSVAGPVFLGNVAGLHAVLGDCVGPGRVSQSLCRPAHFATKSVIIFTFAFSCVPGLDFRSCFATFEHTDIILRAVCYGRFIEVTFNHTAIPQFVVILWRRVWNIVHYHIGDYILFLFWWVSEHHLHRENRN